MASLLSVILLSLISVWAASASESFRIGLTLGLTGRYAKLGIMQQRAYLLWQDHVNKRGGLLGKPVELVIFDDESDPQKAQERYRALIKEKRVDLVFGPYSSAITTAVAPIVEKSGYPMLAAGAASDKIWQQGYTNIFGVFTPASRYAVGMLKLALLNDLRKIAIAYANDPFSISAGEGARKWASQLGLEIVMFEKFPKGQKDLSSLAKKAQLGAASLLLVAGHFNESINMRKALNKIDWYPKAYFATIGPVLLKYEDVLGQDANLTFANSFWEPQLNFSESKKFAASFRDRYSLTPSYQAADAYAAGQILEAAVISAQSLKRDKIRRALSSIRTHTVIGRYGVDPTGIQVKHFGLTVQWQNGAKQIVWPEELATSNPIFR